MAKLMLSHPYIQNLYMRVIMTLQTLNNSTETNNTPLLKLSEQVFILRMAEVMARTGLARSTIYKHIALGNFPKPFVLGTRAVGWRSTDIDTYIASLVQAQGGV
jgi:prophage regulatory protein